MSQASEVKEQKMIDPAKFEEYKTFIDDTARFTERRQNISNLYVTINTLIFAVIAFLIKDIGLEQLWLILLPLPLIVAGVYVCHWWEQLIRKYKLLVGLRIDALREMEESAELAGLAKIYHLEDRLFPRDDEGNMIKGQGLNFSDVEANLPTLFTVLYAVSGVALVIMLGIRLWSTGG